MVLPAMPAGAIRLLPDPLTGVTRFRILTCFRRSHQAASSKDACLAWVFNFPSMPTGGLVWEAPVVPLPASLRRSSALTKRSLNPNLFQMHLDSMCV